MTARENLLRNYPNLENTSLPIFIGCVQEYDKAEAEKGFQRVCFRNVQIVEVEPMRSNARPTCIWRISYELKHDDIELQNLQSDDKKSVEQSLKKLFEDITIMAVRCLAMNVLRKFIGQNGLTAVVEFSPVGCQCANMDFKMATEDPRRWPKITGEVQEVQITLSQMKM